MRRCASRGALIGQAIVFEEIPLNFRLLSVGLVAGLFAALFGVGGGVLTVPALTIFFRFPLKTAIGTSLLAMIAPAIAAVATELFVNPQNLLFELAAWLAMGAIVGTFAGRWVLERLGESALRGVYAAFLILVGMRLLGIFSLSMSLEATGSVVIALCLGIGFLAGASSTLFGIGGGILAVPLLILCVQGITFHEARASSLAMIPVAAAVGVWHHAKMKTLDFRAAWCLGIPACVGSIGGVFLVQEIPGKDLQSIFAFLLVLAAWRLLGGAALKT